MSQSDKRIVRFVVAGEPLTWKRVIPIEGRNGKRISVKDGATRQYQRLIAIRGLEARPSGWPTNWNWYSLRVNVFRSKHDGDWDNYSKNIGDALQAPKSKRAGIKLQGILWDDDNRILDGRVVIHEGVHQSSARLEIEVELVGDLTVEQAMERRDPGGLRGHRRAKRTTKRTAKSTSAG